VVIRRQDDAGTGARVDHRLSVPEREGERLLAQDVLASGGGALGLRAMVLVGAADVDGVDVVPCQDLLERAGHRDAIAVGV
jgi:hypothetical protein